MAKLMETHCVAREGMARTVVAFEASTSMLVAEYVDLHGYPLPTNGSGLPKGERRGLLMDTIGASITVCEKEGFCKTIQNMRAKFGRTTKGNNFSVVMT